MALVLSCEHARADLPPGLELGLATPDLTGHRAWDPGAFELASALALALGAPLLSGQVSRLVVDLNRRKAHEDAVPGVSFGSSVPGNQGLSPEARARRFAAFHDPYRRALEAEIRLALSGGACLHLSVHSFSPALAPAERDFDLGLLFDPARPEEARVAGLLAEELTRAGFDARPNRPYLGTDEGCTTWLRERLPDPGYAGLELELNQRLDAPARERLALTLLDTFARRLPDHVDPSPRSAR